MTRTLSSLAVCALAAAALWIASAQHNTAFGQPQAPDVIYVNGKIVSVDRQFSIASAFAVAGDRFVAVGTDAAMRKLAAPNTRVVDLGGYTVLPGIVDSHPHTIIGHAKEHELH